MRFRDQNRVAGSFCDITRPVASGPRVTVSKMTAVRLTQGTPRTCNTPPHLWIATSDRGARTIQPVPLTHSLKKGQGSPGTPASLDEDSLAASVRGGLTPRVARVPERLLTRESRVEREQGPPWRGLGVAATWSWLQLAANCGLGVEVLASFACGLRGGEPQNVVRYWTTRSPGAGSWRVVSLPWRICH